jgi:homoserine/homoserine lactone efflux protein
MDATLLISFVLVSVALIVVPGPNVLVIVSTSLAHGKTRGLQTVAGTTLAMALQLVVVAISTTWFVQLLTEGFSYLKWIGVLYLIYLASVHIRQALLARETNPINITAQATFARGFLVSATNPKTILFFSAFLPQFIDSSENYVQQISLLSLTFLSLAAALDSCYALLSARLQPLLLSRNMSRMQNGLSGLLYIGASAWLAVTRRT